MTDRRVMIVDDEPAMRLALREVMRPRWEVVEAADGAEALRALQRTRIDLILTDVRMPEVSGLQLLERLREVPEAPPVIVMTAFATIEDAVEAMRMGAVDYLMKPFSSDIVIEAVERALSRRSDPRRSAAVRGGGNGRSRAWMANPHPLIAEDPAMRQTIQFVEAVADSEATILVTGESGVGKEVVARHIHRRSARCDGPFVAINCAALPETLLESELFGFEKGAFTGAVQSRPGRFELASGGTILLDEISEMPMALQAKLLRVLQEHAVDPIGSRQPTAVDIRVIATSNRDMGAAVASGEFRQDLYYRLNVIGIEIPPLRERPRDIEPLALFFTRKHAVRNNRQVPTLSAEVMEHLRSQPWMGNVRELENFIERGVLLTRGEEMRLADLHLHPLSLPHPLGECGVDSRPRTLAEMERQMIVTTLQETGGNRTRAAEILGVSVRTIRNKINEYGLRAAT
ncbi:sigma-54-dependent Fis family transcriptional regulator [Candidatus Sumerlaeota bacterium]|nr:sigma-54-dependent Fis family transcriptional regulator [Candidatus Sumerlaeota bacterium]